MNRGVALLITAIVGIAVGFGSAWALFDQPASPEPASASDLETKVVEPQKNPESRSPDLGVLEPDRTEEARRLPNDAAPSHSSPVSEWSQAELLDEGLLRPSGRITGTVQDEAGSPLADVRIVASPSSAPGELELHSPKDVDLETYLRGRAAYYHWVRATAREARTDGSGAFVLEDLVDAPHRVEAKRDGYEIEGGGEWWRVEPGRTVHFVAKRQYGLEVRVLEASGEPAKSAQVRYRQGNRTSSREWKASKPRLELGAGTFEVWAEREDYRSPSETITLIDGEAPAPMTLQLASRNGVRGRVIFPDGERMDNAVLSYMPVSGPGVDLSAQQLASEGQSLWVRPDQPEFAILDIEPGWWAVGVGRQWNQVDHFEVLEVPEGVVHHDIELPPLARDQVLVVRTRGPDGRPVLDVEFQLSVRTGFSRSSGGAESVRKPEDDSYWILLDDDARGILAGDKEGEVTLQAESAAYGARSLDVPPGPEPSLDIVFGPRATLTVALTGRVDSYVGTLQVRLMEVGAEDRTVTSESIGKTQPAVIGPVQPGHYLVVLASSSGLELDRIGLRLNEGDNSTTLEVPPVYELTVLLDDGSVGRLSLERRRSEPGPSFSQRREADESGRVVFSNVPAGEYTLQHHGGGVPQIMNVRVPTGGEIHFQAQEVNALAVTVTDPNGVLATAGFQTGDLVVAIGGQEIENMQTAMAAMYGAMASTEPIRFAVLRGGARIDLEVDAKELQGGDPGGEFDPTTR